MKALEFKSFNILETKSDDSGNLIISGYAAIFNNVDSGGDMIQKGAFSESLLKRKDRIALCFQHDIWNAVGKITELKEDDKGLFFSAFISAAEDDLQIKIKEGIYKEMSIGYQTKESKNETRNGEDVRVLVKLNLFEISLVTIAMNEMATIEGMKSEEKKEFLEKEFNRLIALIKNENVNFEIRKLKELTVSVLAQKTEPPKEVEELKAERILELLNFKN